MRRALPFLCLLVGCVMEKQASAPPDEKEAAHEAANRRDEKGIDRSFGTESATSEPATAPMRLPAAPPAVPEPEPDKAESPRPPAVVDPAGDVNGLVDTGAAVAGKQGRVAGADDGKASGHFEFHALAKPSDVPEDASKQGGEGQPLPRTIVDSIDSPPPDQDGDAVADERPPVGTPVTEEEEQTARRKHDPEKPAAFLPHTCYFENTYLGGNAAYLERLRRLDEALSGGPHRQAHADPQAFDPPERNGMALTASIDTRWLDKPGRVFLQVGLRGSDRFGWRRPPLELVLVVDSPALDSGLGPLVEVLSALLHGLGPQDRLALHVAGTGEVVPLSRIRSLQTSLPAHLLALRAEPTGPDALAEALALAGRTLREASEHRTTLPGTQTVLVLTSGDEAARVNAATVRAHALTVQGVVTSVIEVGTQSGAWWSVANAGYGSYHRVQPGQAGAAIDAELESLSRVVARLLRVNIRLAPGVEAVRVLGSRVLDAAAVRQVKAREVAADKNLSLTIGIAADRGDDDDGIQTVIPYFLGGESHVILVELWVEKPGKVADVTLRYKDMVTLGNATASASAELRNVPRPATGEQAALWSTLRGFRVAEALAEAAGQLASGDSGSALARLQLAGQDASDADRRLLTDFQRLVASGSGQDLQDALRLAAERRIGEGRP